jgi:hypothetical protein
VEFLNILADVTGLAPHMDQVKSYRAAIQDLCPSIFENEDLPAEFNFDNTGRFENDFDSQAARVSPVSVMEDANDGARRKRSRTETVSRT